jgi:hypothetical protein
VHGVAKSKKELSREILHSLLLWVYLRLSGITVVSTTYGGVAFQKAKKMYAMEFLPIGPIHCDGFRR